MTVNTGKQFPNEQLCFQKTSISVHVFYTGDLLHKRVQTLISFDLDPDGPDPNLLASSLSPFAQPQPRPRPSGLFPSAIRTSSTLWPLPFRNPHDLDPDPDPLASSLLRDFDHDPLASSLPFTVPPVIPAPVTPSAALLQAQGIMSSENNLEVNLESSKKEKSMATINKDDDVVELDADEIQDTATGTQVGASKGKRKRRLTSPVWQVFEKLAEKSIDEYTERQKVDQSFPSKEKVVPDHQESEIVDMLEEFDNYADNVYSAYSKKSELEKYLDETRSNRKTDLDILEYRKINSQRYPTVARMARDILSIPVSTVASEVAFSCGGRVLDLYRSSLKPDLVKALMCSRDWLYGLAGESGTFEDKHSRAPETSTRQADRGRMMTSLADPRDPQEHEACFRLISGNHLRLPSEFRLGKNGPFIEVLELVTY
ncbi:hypothetical protein CRG98_043532 [Punica granatum]|uniref:HAT C-terminal dimerisation domain-containing protein n=1 Tax=Punica granatum TaxID=22663 RepID=A0A2I0HWJ8_PUNGR|nr:hypothetical protein CRG98_043532 [Punica granatum]